MNSDDAAASHKSMLEQLDADIESIISSLSGTSNAGTGISAGKLNNTIDQSADFLSDSRRNSTSYASSDVESTDLGPFGIRRTTLSLGGLTQNQGQINNRLIGSASVNVSLGHRSSAGSGRFLDKFSAVADATREVELLGGGLGSLSIGSKSGRIPSSRRTSFLTGDSSGAGRPFLESSPGSLNENLNGSISGKQSMSEKIDNYLSNASSPAQQFKLPVTNTHDKSRTMSVSSEVNPSENNSTVFDPNDSSNQNIWNKPNAKSAPYIPSNGVSMESVPPYGQIPPQMAMSPPQGYPPQMFSYMPFNQGYPMMPMMSPFQNFPPMQPPQEFEENGEIKESSNAPANGETKESDETTGNNPSVIPVQPQQPQPGFNGGSPPFMYPQSFSPYGFIPPHMDPNQALPPHQFNNGPSPHNNGGRRMNGSGGSSGKRNGRSPKPQSPGSRGPKGPKNQIYRSPLLEDFRNNASKEYKLKDIFGNAIEFSKDQHGSRFIQHELAHSTNEEKEVIFNEIREVAIDLMTDVFGNYVIQKFFEFGTETQKQVLLGEMKGNIKSLSMQMYGCRVVQRAIEFVPEDDQVSIVSELQDSVLNCIKDQNGNHVIQKSIEKIPIEKIDFILKSLKTQIYHLSTHPYGCRVIQRLLEYCNDDDQSFILSELSKFTFFLIQDQYGNYVIQHILEFGKSSDKDVIFEAVSGSVVEFSKHKFASNVVEKMVIFGSDQQRAFILDEVLVGNEIDDGSPVDDKSALGLMMKDQFANYVVQKLVDTTKGPKRRVLIKRIRQYLNQISKSSYGKHLASIEKLLQISEAALADEAK